MVADPFRFVFSSLILAVASALPASMPTGAAALGIFDLPYPSVVLRTNCARRGQIAHHPSCLREGYPNVAGPPFWIPTGTTIWQWDPPAQGVGSVEISFYFNRIKFAPVPGTAGFHCSFTLDGNCPQEEPGVGIQSIDLGGPVVPGSPIGVLDLLTIGTDSVEMRATFSQPISAASGDEIFFSMEFEPLFDIRRYRVLYSQDILPNADYVVTSYSCTTTDGSNQCGSENFTASFKLVPVPLPGAGMFLLSALAMAGAATRRGQRSATP